MVNNKNINEDMTSAVPANAMGTSSSTAGSGGVDTYDPLLKLRDGKKKKLRDILKRKTLEGMK